MNTLLSLLIVVLNCFGSQADAAKPDTSGIFKSIEAVVDLVYSQPDVAIQKLDSFENILKNYPGNRTLAKLYYTKGNAYSLMQKFPESLDAYNKAISIFKYIKDDERLTHTYHSIGALYINKGMLDSAKKYFSESYLLSLQSPDSFMTAIIELDMANIATYEGNYDSALKLLYAAEPVFVKKKNNLRLLLLNSSLGVLNQKIKDFKLSFYYLFKALELDTLVEKINISAGILNSIGETHFAHHNMDSAFYYYKSAYENSNPELDPNTYFGALNNMANVLLTREEYKTALGYYLQAYQSPYLKGDNISITALTINLGYVYLQLKDYDKAEKYLHEGEQMANDYSLLEYEINALSNIYLLDSTQQNYLQAITDLRKYNKLSDSLMTGKTHEKIELIKSKYNLGKNRLENIRLQQEQASQILRIKRQRFMIYLLVAVVLIFFILIVVIVNNRKKIKRLHKDLQKKNNLIEEKSRDMAKSNRELSSLNKMKDKFFSILAHDLRSPFNSILGILELLEESPEDFNEEERSNMISIVNSNAKKEYNLLENLLNWSQLQRGKIVTNPKEVKVKDVFEKSIELYSLNAKQKKIQLDMQVEDNLTAWADVQLIQNVLNNLLNNAIKFTPREGKITLESKLINGRVQICVVDTGVGIPPDKLKKLFDEDNTYRKQGTDYEQGSGLGLVLCREYVELLKGEILVTSTEGKGSSFCLIIPSV